MNIVKIIGEGEVRYNLLPGFNRIMVYCGQCHNVLNDSLLDTNDPEDLGVIYKNSFCCRRCGGRTEIYLKF